MSFWEEGRPGTDTDGTQLTRLRGGAGGRGGGRMAGAPAGGGAEARLGEQLEMSKSIMQKLYRKNVELEKEAQLLRAQLGAGAPPAPAAAALPASAGPSAPPAPLLAVMREKNERIQKLEAELRGQGERARRLQGALTARVEEAEASGSAAAAQRSNFHMRKYKTLRDDYRKLLEQRAGMVGRRAHGGAQQMVGELQQRLDKEMQEREVESALLASQLYERDRRESDLYVEKRLLEQRVEALQREIQERDRLDTEIETCVCALFEKVSFLEKENLRLQGAPAGGG